MGKVLVVGASGQLGTATVRRLLARGSSVRALVRSAEHAEKFRVLGAEPVHGDLTDPPSLGVACTGADVVVATANAAVPTRKRDTFEAVDRDGYRNLIAAAAAAGVGRFVYTSAPRSRYEGACPIIRFKRETEERLAASGLDHVIFRADLFMDTVFAMMGSSTPLRGAENATILRPFAFVQKHRQRIQHLIENDRTAMVPGDGSRRHAFICVDDVAAFLSSAARGGPSGTYAVGGPEALSFLDVVRIYEETLGVSLRVKKTPAAVFRIASVVLRPVSPAAANLMFLNYLSAREDTFADPAAAAAFGVQLTSAGSFLRARSTIAARG